MDNQRYFFKWKRTEDSDTNNNKQPGLKNGIWHKKCAMHIMKSRKKILAKRIEVPTKYKNAWKERIRQTLGNIWSRHHQTSRDGG